MKKTVQIFVRLLDEGVNVWRPIKAKKLEGKTFEILDQPYDQETETWEFEPGTQVICKMVELEHGSFKGAVGLAAHQGKRIVSAPSE